MQAYDSVESASSEGWKRVDIMVQIVVYGSMSIQTILYTRMYSTTRCIFCSVDWISRRMFTSGKLLPPHRTPNSLILTWIPYNTYALPTSLKELSYACLSIQSILFREIPTALVIDETRKWNLLKWDIGMTVVVAPNLRTANYAQ